MAINKPFSLHFFLILTLLFGPDHLIAKKERKTDICGPKNIVKVKNLINPTPTASPIYPWFIYQTITHTVTEYYYTTVTITIPIYK